MGDAVAQLPLDGDDPLETR